MTTGAEAQAPVHPVQARRRGAAAGERYGGEHRPRRRIPPGAVRGPPVPRGVGRRAFCPDPLPPATLPAPLLCSHPSVPAWGDRPEGFLICPPGPDQTGSVTIPFTDAPRRISPPRNSPMPSLPPLGLAELRRLARALEGRPCGCPVKFGLKVCQLAGRPCVDGCDCPRWPGKPCRHVKGLWHKVPRSDWIAVKEWAAILLALDPAQYAGRPPDARPARVLSRQARVEVLIERQRAGLDLWNSGDVFRCDMEAELKVALLSVRDDGSAGRLANGACSAEQALAMGGRE